MTFLASKSTITEENIQDYASKDDMWRDYTTLTLTAFIILLGSGRKV
jgi:hypothetical protein